MGMCRGCALPGDRIYSSSSSSFLGTLSLRLKKVTQLALSEKKALPLFLLRDLHFL